MPEVFGVDDRVHFLILGCFIPTHLTTELRCDLCSIDMNLRKNMSTETVFVM